RGTGAPRAGAGLSPVVAHAAAHRHRRAHSPARATSSTTLRARPRCAAERASPDILPMLAVRKDWGWAVTYVINEPCIGTKDNSCVEVCPVDCIHPTPDEPDLRRGRDAVHRSR